MIRRACDLGAADFISRPFFGDIIIRRIENVLSMYLGMSITDRKAPFRSIP